MNLTILIISFFIAFTTSLVITPIIRKQAIKFRIVDHPDARKIHREATPYLGGISIFFGVLLAYVVFWPEHEHQTAIIISAFIMLITGLLDDLICLRPVYKLAGQGLSAIMIVSSGLLIEKINIPLFGEVQLDNLSIIVTILWILAVSNAINLIDGLDGLAAGVTNIALTSIIIMAFLEGNLAAAFLSIIVLGSNFGFLYFNFYPAKIYMGDSGSLFLGYMVAIISMLGLFKNVTLFSFIIPLLVIAVPIVDTFFTIIRRLKNGESVMIADRKHIHHQLLDAGFSHRGAVLTIYLLSALFGTLAILFGYSNIASSVLFILIALFLVHIIAEMAGLVLGGKKPVLILMKKLTKNLGSKTK
ncbi:glycosyltransferase family 4 protein [Alkalibacillus almallahensis]|uniref:glycosyltransferase family 4 protein n=1 Tax=Alkalibacillus almallahensis TaxID=1379154 RepID=UPI00141FDCA0|nr:MraY family glycosyltransferase [Alkalibacillus almallahensis]NIK11809.1 UDP-GlcNAc:undecaprenyl-phosphate GlcNAc-1-phosphate transferase [Alkalibacillus almallahensis]